MQLTIKKSKFDDDGNYVGDDVLLIVSGLQNFDLSSNNTDDAISILEHIREAVETGGITMVTPDNQYKDNEPITERKE